MLAELAGRRVLLLQGPSGLFFRRLATELEAAGAETLRVTMNAGDAAMHLGRSRIAFRGQPKDWPGFIESVLRTRGIEAIVLFGDMRPMHKVARGFAEALGIPVYVIEEGYLRPDHITVEREGVNGNSRMSKDPEFYRAYGRKLASGAEKGPSAGYLRAGSVFGRAAWWSTLHALAATNFFFLYPHSEHHRDLNCWRHTYYWVRGTVRKWIYGIRERGLERKIKTELAGRYFLVPLQVSNDAQLLHSRFESVESFIEDVIVSFAHNAREGDCLVLKHHPFDRPYVDHCARIESIAEREGIAGRVIALHDQHLPSLLRDARGTVVINSTVGMSSLHHGTPVIALGEAVYDLKGLTHSGGLDSFWEDPGAVDSELYRCLRRWMLAHNQFNGSVWRVVDPKAGATGIRWGA